jgi:hypothetical protein
MLPVLALFANSIAKIKHTTQKTNNVYYTVYVSWNPILHLSPVWDVPFCQKVKIVVP